MMASMWPFKRKSSAPDHLPIDGPWAVAEGEHNGKTMIVRINTGYRNRKSVPGYEHQVGISVPLKKPEIGGLPGPAEGAVLGEIEDTICNSLEKQAESLLVAVITTGGMREFVFYTRQPDNVQDRVTKLRERITSHEIQVIIQSDKDWEIFAQLS